jgi:glycosyltransferase involved in cell wall biosynthesis
MRILQVAYELSGDGGSNAVVRLHRGLENAGIDSRVLCYYTDELTSGVAKWQLPSWQQRVDARLRRLSQRLGLNGLLDASSRSLTRHQAFREADLLVIQGVYAVVSYLALPRLTADKPAVIPLHDMWTFTGHCYHSFECERWKSGCGRCPHPEVTPAIRRDSTRLEWFLKNWAYRRSRLAVIAPSTWIAGLAKQSMLGHFPIHHIPHGVDTDAYRPLDRTTCREALGIPRDKKAIAFATADLRMPIKGPDLLLEVIRALPTAVRSETVLILLGHHGTYLAHHAEIPVVNLGFVSSDRLKAVALSAADLFVYPTRADTFPYAVLESIACGTPVVSFSVGGVPDIVRNGKTGLAVPPGDVRALRDATVQLLTDESRLARLRTECRAVAEREFTLDLQVERYVDVFRKTLGSASYRITT